MEDDRLLLERKCLHLFMKDKVFFLENRPKFSKEVFTEKAHQFIYMCIAAFRGSLTPAIYAAEVAKRTKKEETKLRFLDIFQNVVKERIVKGERDYIIQELLLRKRADDTMVVMRRYLDIAEKGNYQEAEELFYTHSRLLRQETFRTPIEKGEILEDFEERRAILKERDEDKTKRYGVLTGMKGVDKYSGGLYPGEVGTIFGLNSSGKSTLAMGFAHSARCQGKTVLIISLEMPKLQVMLRYDSFVSGLTYKDHFKFGRMDDEALKRWKTRLEETAKFGGKLYVVSVPPLGFTPTGILDILDEYGEQGIHFDVVVVDYINLMESDSRSKWEQQELGLIIKNFKGVAIERKLSIWVVAQQSKPRKSQDDDGAYEPESQDVGYSQVIA